MQITKMSKEKKILDSGSIITFDSTADISFDVQFDNNFSFKLIFKFENDANNKSHSLNFNLLDNTITFSCVNFNNVLGTGTKKPLEIATVENKKVFITFWVTAMGLESLKRLDYSIYQEN